MYLSTDLDALRKGEGNVGAGKQSIEFSGRSKWPRERGAMLGDMQTPGRRQKNLDGVPVNRQRWTAFTKGGMVLKNSLSSRSAYTSSGVSLHLRRVRSVSNADCGGGRGTGFPVAA